MRLVFVAAYVANLILSGVRILGHVIAVRPGHGPNTELARAIVQQYNQMRSMVPAPVNMKPLNCVMATRNVIWARVSARRLPMPTPRSKRRSLEWMRSIN